MKTWNQNRIRYAVLVAVLILTAAVCRVLSMGDPRLAPLGLLRSAIYLGLFSAWGISVRNRIIQPQVRGYLTGIAALMVFWMLIRSVKFHVALPASIPDAGRILWYLYYLPMLFIPLLAVLVALTLGKPENYRLPGWMGLLWLPPTVLLLLVLTNDLHQLVFSFPADAAVWTDGDYSRGIGYFIAAAWSAACTFTALGTMLVKCRVPRGRMGLLLPFFPVVAMVLYGITYVLGAPWLKVIGGDMTVTLCLLLTAAMESCIQCGLIQSNTRYDDLLRSCMLRVQLTDSDYRLLLASHSAQPIPPELMRQTETAPVQLEDGLRLSGARVSGGHVLWTEDVSELLDVLERLEDAKESLEDSNSLLRAEYALKAREAHVAEQDRLYNLIQRETAAQIGLLVSLTEELEKTGEEEARRKLLGKLVVIGAYLKRRSNLIFLADKTPLLPEKEVSLTFGESLDNLELYGVACGFRAEVSRLVPAAALAALYDFFEEIVERSLDSMTAVTVWIDRDGNGLRMTVNTDAQADFGELSATGAEAVQDEDGEWQLSLCVPLGGEAP